MDLDCDDQAIQAVLGPEQFDGIDNDGLDFSQLENFINDEHDAANLYFPEGLVVTTCSTGKSTACPTSYAQSDPVPQTTSTTIISPPFNKSPCYTNSHNLPESPPDSSSEPPYSPTNNDDKMNGGAGTNAKRMSLQNQHKSPNCEKPFSLYENYSNTVPLKHLPDINLPIPNSISLSVQSLASVHQAPLQAYVNDRLSHSNGPNVNHMNGGNILTQPPPYIENAHCANQISVSNNIPSPVYTIPTPEPTAFTPKKRKLSNAHKKITNDQLNSIIQVKHEPGLLSGHNVTPVNCPNGGGDQDHLNYDQGDPSSSLLDSIHQCIHFQEFNSSDWHSVCDINLTKLPPPLFKVDADKGFSFSPPNNSFVCQKKNHFQVTAHIKGLSQQTPYYVETPEGLKVIDNYYIHFFGVKFESPNQTIKLEQSQSDRTKRAFNPVIVNFSHNETFKLTVGRMHFSETTSNNMRKNGKPNPDQRYFNLVVSLNAHCGNKSYTIMACSSDKIIVRASNPAQFENESENAWQKGQTSESVYHNGRVGINTDQPDEALVIHGNLKITGRVMQPSDLRAKENIEEVDSKIQLENVSQMRIVKYQYEKNFAKQAGISKNETNDTGVIAQEVKNVLPDAVREAGDILLPNGKKIENFLVVNKERIFMENVGAVKELCKVTNNLGSRINELEKMNEKLKLKRIDSIKSTSSVSTITGHTCTKRRRHRHTKCNKNDDSLCSNRSVQITIFVLILVMAFCLISMVTVYICETESESFYMKDGNVMRLNRSGKPWIHDHISTTKRGFTQNNDTTTQFFTVFPAVTMPPPVIGQPSTCLELTVDPIICPVYCCSSTKNSFDYAISKPQNEDVMFSPKQAIPIDSRRASSRSMSFNGLSPSTSTENSKKLHSNKYNDKNMDKNDISGNKVPAYNGIIPSSEFPTPGTSKDWSMPSLFSNQQASSENKKRYVRTVNGNSNKMENYRSSPRNIVPLDRNVLFKIPEFNFTLSSDHCISQGCTDGTGSRMSYSLPISKYMNHKFIHLNVTLVPGMAFDFCSIHYESKCPVSSIKSTHQKPYAFEPKRGIIQTSIDLPLMLYTEFTLYARLTRPVLFKKRELSCKAPASDMGRKYIQYEFKFFKVCDRE